MRRVLARVTAALSRVVGRLRQPRRSTIVARRLERYVGPSRV